MEEHNTLIWSGKPSQVLNLRYYVGVFMLLFFITLWYDKVVNIVSHLPLFGNDIPLAMTILYGGPLCYAAWKWLVVKVHKYELTEEIFRERYGVFNRHVQELELYRIKDTSIYQPFDMLIFGLGNIVMQSSDRSTPVARIMAIKDSDNLRSLIRERVEIMRRIKGVREFD